VFSSSCISQTGRLLGPVSGCSCCSYGYAAEPASIQSFIKFNDVSTFVVDVHVPSHKTASVRFKCVDVP